MDLQPSPPTRRPQPQAAHRPLQRAEQPGWVLQLVTAVRHGAAGQPRRVAQARYVSPASTLTVLSSTRSVTLTVPLTTRVSVPSQRSEISHTVPSAAAVAYLPLTLTFVRFRFAAIAR